MGKRKAPVPAALHRELSEYTSLLRALKNTDNLDLASQLIKPVASSQHTVPVPSSPDSAASKPQAKEKGKLKGKSKGKQQDNWTRWPLLPGEFAAPEFTFDDEVRALAAEALLIQREYEYADADVHLPLSEGSHMVTVMDTLYAQDQPQSLEQDVAEREEEEEEEEPEPEDLPAADLSALNLTLSTYLTQILAAIAAHVPRAEKSMQNRLKPLGWQSVLEIMAAAGCCAPDALEDIDRRMCAIYPVRDDENPSPHTAASRAHRTRVARSSLSSMVARFEDSIFDAPKPPQMRDRKKYKSEKFVHSEDEENDGSEDEDGESLQ
ncbi:hypothetical protein FIBSPDRAFT_795058 [Athelia psychrophila]|uniref:Rrn9 domain-containing protein n=1 Tax=Athelia psychrophila TaxID=1759441 RepID=A0A166EJH7_9AGAM|nr:hypothetical protein FIBSPDRAFT_795058 [Fibularhizoctonia sp. CBS 109695]